MNEYKLDMICVTGRSAMDEDEGPKLWCGMGNGKVKVFDGSTWLLETTQIQAKDRVVRLYRYRPRVNTSHALEFSID